MSSPANKEEKNRLLALLWEVFLAKIDEEWEEKYSQIGQDRKTLGQTDQLAHAVYEDLLASMKSKKPTFSTKSLANYLQNDQFSSTVKKDTLSVFLHYVGCNNWEEFKQQYDNDPLFGLPNSRASAKEKKKDKQNPFRNPWNYLGPILLLLFLPVGYSMLRTPNLPQGLMGSNNVSPALSTIEISDFIESANQLELRLRQQVPNLQDTSQLNDYFTPDGPAKTRIISGLLRSVQENRRLTANTSTTALLDCTIVADRQLIQVKTKEHWRLRWENTLDGMDLLQYDTINVQQYQIARTPAGFRIHTNELIGS